jgi:hypothetical protein
MRNIPDTYGELRVNYLRVSIIVFFVIFLSFFLKAQTNSYTQLCNELQLARAINDKWAGEAYFGGAFSNTPSESRVLKTNILRYINLWAHYYFSPRWKFSSSLAYYYNKDVPDIGQYYSPEYRFTLQGIYYFHKMKYTLFTRMRMELRYMMNADGVFEDKYRYRQMVKFIKPLNSMVLRKSVFYLLSTEELLFKPNAKSSGINFFDRNRFELGGGYLITDDIQIELSYVNEFMPRDEENEVYNQICLTITLNNLLLNLRKKLTSGPEKSDQQE